METWILLFTVWILGADEKFTAQETRVEFSTAEDCSNRGKMLNNEATAKQQPAIYFCFRKGERIGD